VRVSTRRSSSAFSARSSRGRVLSAGSARAGSMRCRISAASSPEQMRAIANPPMRTSITSERAPVRMVPEAVCIANQMS